MAMTMLGRLAGGGNKGARKPPIRDLAVLNSGWPVGASGQGGKRKQRRKDGCGRVTKNGEVAGMLCLL